jgi:hypothetical protein
MVGGLMIILGVVLPWMSDSLGNSISGLSAGVNSLGIVILLFGVLGLAMVASGERGLAIGAMVFAILALLLYLLLIGVAGLVATGLGAGITTGYGLYVGFIGSIVLIVGAVMAMSAAKKAVAAPVAPPAPPNGTIEIEFEP